MSRRGWVVLVASLLIGGGVGVGGMQAALDAAFDRGMAAGVEYQSYWCIPLNAE